MTGSSNHPIDAEKSTYYFKKAAEQGHAQAQFILGTKYAHGNGVLKDVTMSAFWNLRAAEGGTQMHKNKRDGNTFVVKASLRMTTWHFPGSARRPSKGMLEPNVGLGKCTNSEEACQKIGTWHRCGFERLLSKEMLHRRASWAPYTGKGWGCQ